MTVSRSLCERRHGVYRSRAVDSRLVSSSVESRGIGAPDKIRTCDLCLRKVTLTFSTACGRLWPSSERRGAPPVAKYGVVHSGFYDVADLRFEPPIATGSALPGRWVTVHTGDMGYTPPECEARAHDVGRALYERRRRRPSRPPKTLQETLQLCTEQSGKKGCKVLARSRFSASYGTEVNEIPSLFQLFATQNPGGRPIGRSPVNRLVAGSNPARGAKRPFRGRSQTIPYDREIGKSP